MQTELIEGMREQVRAIHRVLTGTDLPEHDGDLSTAPEAGDEEVTERFLELEAAVRALPSLARRLPPFSFTPPVDVIAGDGAVIVEICVPGVDRGDVTVAVEHGSLVVSGVRRDAANETYHHAETPRGPFLRAIPLPFPLSDEPRVELERGVLRIFLAAASIDSAARNTNVNTDGDQPDDDRDE